jgi:hypothetical protein
MDGSTVAILARGKAARGRNGIQNKLQPEDRPAHDWYRFVLSYPPHLVRDYVARFGLGSDDCVLDPFCGTGTTLVECKKLGIESVGIEANPMAWFASSVKVDWSVDSKQLARHAEQVAESVLASLQSAGIDDDGLPLFNRRLRRIVSGDLRTLPEEQMRLLLTGSISAKPLHKTLLLLDELERNRCDLSYRHERLALAKAIVFGISNLHFGPEVGVESPKSDAPVVATWLDGIRAIVDDLHVLRKLSATRARVFRGDSRTALKELSPKSVTAVITSPPYPNEKDYTRTTRLESVLLGFIHTKDDLRDLKRQLIRSNTRGVYKSDTDDIWVEQHAEIQRLASQIEQRRIELKKTSGFERMYSRVTKLYFGGMLRHFTALSDILRPGARLAYVVGDQASYLRVMIRTGQLIADIASSAGYKVVGIDLFRTRLATATKEQLREEVVVLEWPGKKRKRGAKNGKG